VTEIEITLADAEDAAQVLDACATFLTARDMMAAQASLSPFFRESPLTAEVQRLKTRFDGYLGDYLLARRRAEEGEDERPEEPEEELSSDPLGQGTLPGQQGRRLSREELTGVAFPEDDAVA
jgi:hypothetical protein